MHVIRSDPQLNWGFLSLHLFSLLNNAFLLIYMQITYWPTNDLPVSSVEFCGKDYFLVGHNDGSLQIFTHSGIHVGNFGVHNWNLDDPGTWQQIQVSGKFSCFFQAHQRVAHLERRGTPFVVVILAKLIMSSRARSIMSGHICQNKHCQDVHFVNVDHFMSSHLITLLFFCFPALKNPISSLPASLHVVR